MHEMKAKMAGFGEDLAAMRTDMKHINDRTLRGEKVMMAMQGEQRQDSRLLQAIASKLNVEVPKPVPESAEPQPAPDTEDIE